MSQSRKQFGKIYDKNVEKIYRFIVLKVSSPEIAEDLTSEVFARGWQVFNDKKRDIENVTAFLYQIARNLVVDHYREKARVQFVSVENVRPIADIGINLEKEAILKSDVDEVKAALASIKEDYREVIIWYYLDELKVPEIAKMLERSEEAVRVLIHRALKSLRAAMSEKQ